MSSESVRDIDNPANTTSESYQQISFDSCKLVLGMSTSQYVFTKARFYSWRVPLKQFFILLSSYFYQSGAGGAVSLTV
jgi:hypothetical protein